MAHRTRQEVHRAHLYTNTWLRDKPNSTLFSTSRGGSGVPPRFSSALSSNKTASMSRPSTSMQSSNLTEQSEIAKAVTPLQTNNVSTPIRNRNAVTLTSMGTEMPKSPESSSSPSNKNSNNMNESSLAVDSLPNLLPVRGASGGSMRNLLPTTNGNQMHQLASINQRSHYYHSPNNHRVVGTTASAGPNRAKGTRHMILQPNRALLEDQDPQYHDKLVVVLDLDETLAYGRTFGHPKLRPHLHKFLQTLQDLECEVVLWTAGERGYAFSMLEVIDPHGCLFQHCVYRHPRWWSGPRGHKKDLALLGRSLERTFIVENTPDCVRDCVANAILVSDYVGPVAGALGRTQPDHVLSELAQCIQGMWSEIQSGVVSSVAQALQRSPFLIQRTVGADHVPCSVTTWTLRSDPRILQCNMPARCSPDPSEDILDRVLDSTYAMSSICYNSNKPKNSEKRFATTSALRSNTMMVAGTRDGSKEVGQATRWLSHLDVKCSVSDPSSLMHPIRFSTVPQKKSVGLKSPSRTWKDTGLESSQDTLSKSQGSVVDPTSRAIIGAGRKVLGEYTAALNRLNIATGKNHKVHRYPRKNTLGFRDF